ncbi:MAG: phytoene desaturase [Chloroflexi bacterium]|nr:phytoene desaturase [Chloroflexota bacterium]
MTDPIVIIGAGIGGLSAAIRLATAGKRVIVVEKNAQVGGKMAEIHADGFRWDTGPSVITMRHVFEDLFAAAGRDLADYLTLLPVEPLTRYFYPDGTRLDATRDLAAMAQQIARLDERDVEGYLAYLAYAARIHRITGPVFIYDQPPTPASFARVPVPDWLRVDALRTMQQAIEGFVRAPHLRQLLGRFATYVGGSPYLAPATLNVIAHVELTGGVWYPRGGVYSIARALEKLARELDVEIRPGCPVRQIRVQNGRVTGVALENGTSLSAAAVIANVDVTTVYQYLLPPDTGARHAQPLEPSCSGYILLLGVEKSFAGLAHHNIFFSRDYRHEFRQIFRDGHMPDDPTIYLAITSKTDAAHAPVGCENWFVLVNAPPISDKYDWQQHALPYRDEILARLAEYGFDARGHIRSETRLTPHDLQRLTGAYRGALYGASPNDRFSAFRRPHNRARGVRGLYFAGGTTHPGGGVPMVTLSGKVAAQLLLDDLS